MATSTRPDYNDRVLQELERIEWTYVDMTALTKLEERVAATGRRQELISYSDLVRGIRFRIENVRQGEPYEIDVQEWQPLDRAIIGEFLGQISARSYKSAKFMASALVISQLEGRPSEHFFNWMIELGAMSKGTEDAKLEFWSTQVKKAHQWYTHH